MDLHHHAGARGGPRWILYLFVLILLAAPFGAIGFVGITRETPEPEITVETSAPLIGRQGTVTVRVSEPKRGLSAVKVELTHSSGAQKLVLEEKSFGSEAPWKIWWKGETSYSHRAEVGKDAIADLKEGPVVVRVTAAGHGNWVSAPKKSEKEITVNVRLTPPLLVPTSQFVYVAQGGCEVVTYEVGETSVKDGVVAGDWFFPGYPLPGGKPTERFAIFGIPYEMSRGDEVKLIADDAVGNHAEVKSFFHKFTPRPIGKDTIKLEDKFLEKVTTEILGQTAGLEAKGTPLDRYLVINSDLRKKNNAFLKEIAKNTRPAFLWKEVFVQMPNTAVKGSFADRRTYLYAGKGVDTQDHLGFDLASNERAPVPAANSGAVVFAKYLGIFGNAVVIDHGYGLMSLYAHLSSIDVKEGQQVARAETIGRSGATGLAGGDHLHFTTLLHGLPVTPVEWWDAHWIQDRIKLKLGSALPWELADR